MELELRLRAEGESASPIRCLHLRQRHSSIRNRWLHDVQHNPRLYVLAMLVAVAFISLGTSNAAGKVAAAESTIDSDKAMRILRGNRWYNSEEQAYNPPVLAKPVDDSIRRNGWEAQPSSWMWDWDWSWPSFGSGFGGWGISADAMGWVLLSVLGTALIGGIIAVLYFYLRDSLPFQKRAANRSKSLKIDPMKVEDLPFEVCEQSGDPLRDAELLICAGRYNEAVVYLYGYMLCAIMRKIHLQKGKTNRMYLRTPQPDRAQIDC